MAKAEAMDAQRVLGALPIVMEGTIGRPRPTERQCRAASSTRGQTMPTESIRFAGPRAELSARLDTPVGQPRAYALFAHCFTCSKESKAAAYVSQALAGYGIATLRFDFSGL